MSNFMKSSYYKISIVFSCLFLFPPIGEGLYAQDSELFEYTWYLTKVTVDDIDYIPSDFGFYPDIQFSEFNGVYGLSLADPMHISCSYDIFDFQTNPNSFEINENSGVCFPYQTCIFADVPGDPCTIIYGNHALIYYETNSPLIYSIEQNSNETYTLEIINNQGNQAFYFSEFLSIEDFKFNELSIYPNPTDNILYLSNTFNQEIKATIYNLQGKLLQSQTMDTSQTQIDVKPFKPGLYFVVFESKTGERISKKFIKN